MAYCHSIASLAALRCDAQEPRGCAPAAPRDARLLDPHGPAVCVPVVRLCRDHAVRGSCLVDKDLSKIAVNVPIPFFVCISQCAFGNSASNTHVVELLLKSSQATFDISKAFPIGKLSKSHAQELIKTSKRANSVVTTISIDALTKFLLGHKIHDLRKYCFALIHSRTPFAL